MRSVSLLVHRVQFVITRVILPVKPPGKNRVLRGGDLSCSLSAMKGASLFIGSASYGRCILNVYTKRSSTSLGESSAKYNIISLTQAHLRKHKYNIISLTQAHLRKQLTRARFVTSVLRSNHYAFSLSLSNNCREGPNNIEFRSKSFQRYHRELKRYFKIR